ncbi:uncharacterized protein VB005_01893 [Metarhizium brunneum]
MASVDAQQWFDKVLPRLAEEVRKVSISATNERNWQIRDISDQISMSLDMLYLSLRVKKENMPGNFQLSDESCVTGFFRELDSIISPAVLNRLAARNVNSQTFAESLQNFAQVTQLYNCVNQPVNWDDASGLLVTGSLLNTYQKIAGHIKTLITRVGRSECISLLEEIGNRLDRLHMALRFISSNCGGNGQHGIKACRLERDPYLLLQLFVDQSQRLFLYPQLLNETPSCRWTKSEEITLDRVMPYNAIDYTEKMILCLVLAHSFLSLLETGWLPSHWGLSNISIFRPEKSKEIVLRKPYLSTQFENDSSPEPSQAIHGFPQLLWLAIVVMRLLLANNIGDLDSWARLEVGSMVNNALEQAETLLQECKQYFSFRPVLFGIRKCLNLRSKPPYPLDFVYLYLVRPLERSVLDTLPATLVDVTWTDLVSFLRSNDKKNAALANETEITLPNPIFPRTNLDHHSITSTTTSADTNGELAYAVGKVEAVTQLDKDAQNA